MDANSLCNKITSEYYKNVQVNAEHVNRVFLYYQLGGVLSVEFCRLKKRRHCRVNKVFAQFCLFDDRSAIVTTVSDARATMCNDVGLTNSNMMF